MQVPVFINCRNRVTPLVELLAWLERAGLEEIYLLDNDSTYEPLLELYERTPHTVVRLGRNVGSRALWLDERAHALIRGRPYVHSDPDVVPIEECPLDALERFNELLARYPGVDKAGFGLRIDDLPDHYPHKDAVLRWEGQMWRWPLGGGAYYASIDTTFALHRAGSGARPVDAVRTGPPYVARHTDWYLDPGHLSEEALYYSAHASHQTNWSGPELPAWIARDVERQKLEPAPAHVRAQARRALTWTRIHWKLRGGRLIRRRATGLAS